MWTWSHVTLMVLAWRSLSIVNRSTNDKAFMNNLSSATGPHHCGGPDRFQTTGLTSVSTSIHLIQIGIGRYAARGAFSIPRKIRGLCRTDQSCHHETWLHLDFVDWRISNHITKNFTDEFHSKSVLRLTIMERKWGRSVITWATIRSRRERATIRMRSSTQCENMYILTKWPDDVSHSVAVMLLLLLEECIHHKPLCLIVWILQCLSSWNTVQLRQHA